MRDGVDSLCWFFFFKQKTAYEIGTGDWSSDVCSSDLKGGGMKADRVTEGSGYRNKKGFRKDVEEGKYKQEKDADYYKSIGLTGKRGDQAVEDFFKPYQIGRASCRERV